VHVRNAVFQIPFALYHEAKALVEIQQVLLRPNLDGLRPKQRFALPDGLVQQRPAQAGAPVARRRHDPPDAGLRVAAPGLKQARVGRQLARGGVAQQVVGGLVVPVDVLKRAGLLDHKDFAAQLKQGVKFGQGEGVEGLGNPVEIHWGAKVARGGGSRFVE
jgi:hypothetical protein